MELVGKKIKKRRILKKYSLEDVTAELNIPKEILENIESDKFALSLNDFFKKS